MTTRTADIVLPSSTILEGSGTFLSMEGRAQRFLALRTAAVPVQDSWRWLDELAALTGRGTEARNLDSVDAAIAAELPELAAILRAAPGSGFRLRGWRIPRGARRESGRTAMYANLDVREPNPSVDPDSSLAFSMEGPRDAPPSLLSRYWAPGWNSDQSLHKFQMEAGGTLRGGEIGTRIFEAAPDREALRGAAGGAAIPPAFARRDGALLVLPRHHAFGSEELSARSPALATRIPEPMLFLSIPDAGRLGLSDGKLAEITFADEMGEDDSTRKAVRLVLPVTVADLPEGLASLPWGLPGLPGAPVSAWASVRPVPEEAR